MKTGSVRGAGQFLGILIEVAKTRLFFELCGYMKQQNSRFRFSILRMLVAITLFSMPFAVFSKYGISGNVIATIVGACFLLIAFNDHSRVYTIKLWRLLIGVSGGIFAGTLSITMTHEVVDDVLRRLIGGGLAGGAVALIWNRYKQLEDDWREY